MLPRKFYDALVVGARCAGAATAMLMAREGLRVLVIDRAAYGTDTTSTHAMMRGGVLQLHLWGVLPRLREVGTPPVRRTTFHYGDEVLAVDIRAANGVDALYAPRRSLLDSTLVDAARDAGAVVAHNHTLVGLTCRSNGRIGGAMILDADGEPMEVRSDLVVGADGAGSCVARIAGAATQRAGRHATAVAYGYFSGIDLEGYAGPGYPGAGYHWWYRHGAAAGAIPTNGGRHCVFVAMPPARLRDQAWRGDRTEAFREIAREVDPSLAAAIGDRQPDEPLRLFTGRAGFMRQCHGPGWALVGDAGYFKDPLTAHGITDALRDAELLSNASVGGTEAAFARYAAIRDDLSIPLFEVSDAIAALDWDLEQVKALHLTLNQAMKREVEHILTLGDARAPHPTLIEEQVI